MLGVLAETPPGSAWWKGQVLQAQPMEPKHPQIDPAERRKLMGKGKLMALWKSD